MILILFGCRDFSLVIPCEVNEKLSSYTCWPYEVDVYSVGSFNNDSLFYTFPKNEFFREATTGQTTKWTKYDIVDTSQWYGMDKYLKDFPKNGELYEQRKLKSSVYYCGYYQYYKNRKGEKRIRYEKILFLDKSNRKLYIFVNKE